MTILLSLSMVLSVLFATLAVQAGMRGKTTFAVACTLGTALWLLTAISHFREIKSGAKG